MKNVKFIKQPKSITLYSRPMCGWCIEAKEWLDEQGLKYTAMNVGTDLAARGSEPSILADKRSCPLLKLMASCSVISTWISFKRS
jgi:glutaredoxin